MIKFILKYGFLLLFGLTVIAVILAIPFAIANWSIDITKWGNTTRGWYSFFLAFIYIFAIAFFFVCFKDMYKNIENFIEGMRERKLRYLKSKKENDNINKFKKEFGDI